MSSGKLAGLRVKGRAVCVYRETPDACPVWPSIEGACGAALSRAGRVDGAGERPACTVWRCANGHSVYVREANEEEE